MACCKNKPGEVPTFTSARFILAYVGFFGFFWLYALRFNMSVGIVCMVKNPPKKLDVTTNATSEPTSGNNTYDRALTNEEKCEAEGLGSNNRSAEGEFEWDRPTQGMVLSAFFWGYIITQVPGGWLANKYGGKLVLGSGMALTALATLLLPVAARGSVHAVIFLRVVMGFGTGTAFPAMHGLWARWAPSFEKTKLMTLCYSGTMIGNIFTFFVSGLLCEYGFDGGWPSIFYLMGIGTAIWLLFWIFLVYDTPSVHPRISDEEKEYILQSVGANTFKDAQNVKTPWLSFIKSPPLLAIVVAHVCNNWGNYTMMTSLPTYMKDVLKFNMKSNGLFTALPYMGMFVASIGGGQVSDILRARGVTTTVVRKTVQCIAFVLPAAFTIATGFLDCTQRGLAVAFLTIAVTTSALNRSGYIVNHVDIAPRFAGVLFGLTNTFATVPGMLAPLAVGQLTKDRSRASWQIVFYLCGGFYLFGALVYTKFASGVEQEWAKAKPEAQAEDGEALTAIDEKPKENEAEKDQNEVEVKTPLQSEKDTTEL
ncbi:sialin-like isoform X2 [Tubulanus polymorphus]|uniref:sialin-like isoform X2 n=1 Tax=Tubulanus polymorphus TaxID=672921 RepID=UPI003DA39D6F